MPVITEVIDFEDGDGPWNHLRFADDILVFATSSQNVTYLLIQLAVALAKSGLLSSVGRGNSFQCKRVDPLSAQKLKYFDRIASFLVVRVLQQVTELYTAMTCTIWMLHIRDFSGQGPGLLASWLGRQVKSSQVKSKPGRRVAGAFRAQAVNQKRQYLQIRIYKSLHFRPCRSCRRSQKVPTMFFCPVRIPSNARVVCSDRRLRPFDPKCALADLAVEL